MKNVGNSEEHEPHFVPVLRKFNGIMSSVHLVQAVLMMVAGLSIACISRFRLPLTSNFLSFDIASPRLVYAILGMHFVLQYRKIGEWADYRYGERGYILPSRAAKSLLAWLVFSGPSSPRSMPVISRLAFFEEKEDLFLG